MVWRVRFVGCGGSNRSISVCFPEQHKDDKKYTEDNLHNADYAFRGHLGSVLEFIARVCHKLSSVTLVGIPTFPGSGDGQTFCFRDILKSVSSESGRSESSSFQETVTCTLDHHWIQELQGLVMSRTTDVRYRLTSGFDWGRRSQTDSGGGGQSEETESSGLGDGLPKAVGGEEAKHWGVVLKTMFPNLIRYQTEDPAVIPVERDETGVPNGPRNWSVFIADINDAVTGLIKNSLTNLVACQLPTTVNVACLKLQHSLRIERTHFGNVTVTYGRPGIEGLTIGLDKMATQPHTNHVCVG
eukprot:GDKI01007398.1.p1 GENE.GDKI01007398.1~~GDKI01007398.1.p1  ORF type:complete len:299 (-),score=61.60 GDKI01007398.1:307-1203(-)